MINAINHSSYTGILNTWLPYINLISSFFLHTSTTMEKVLWNLFHLLHRIRLGLSKFKKETLGNLTETCVADVELKSNKMKVCLEVCQGWQAQWTSPAGMAHVFVLGRTGAGHDSEGTRVSVFRDEKRDTIDCTHAHGKLHIYLAVFDSFFSNPSEIAFPSWCRWCKVGVRLLSTLMTRLSLINPLERGISNWPFIWMS